MLYYWVLFSTISLYKKRQIIQLCRRIKFYEFRKPESLDIKPTTCKSGTNISVSSTSLWCHELNVINISTETRIAKTDKTPTKITGSKYKGVIAKTYLLASRNIAFLLSEYPFSLGYLVESGYIACLKHLKHTIWSIVCFLNCLYLCCRRRSNYQERVMVGLTCISNAICRVVLCVCVNELRWKNNFSIEM